MDSKRVSVLGGGGWGTALAHIASEQGHEVRLWCREDSVRESIEEHHENETFLPGVPLALSLGATTELSNALVDADLVLFVVPSAFLAGVVENAKSLIGPRACLVSASKGIETSTLRRMSEVVNDALGDARPLVVLSGPSFAREVALGKPTALVAASSDPAAAETVRGCLSNEAFQIHTSDDTVGVELGGALKNVVAVAAGMAQGAGLGSNATAALMTRGLFEISRLAVSMGGAAETLAGLAGMGDLVLTCTGELSRNRSVGVRLGKGESLSHIIDSMHMVAEGVETTRAANRLGRRHAVPLPIARAVERVLDGELRAEAAMRSLFAT